MIIKKERKVYNQSTQYIF